MSLRRLLEEAKDRFTAKVPEDAQAAIYKLIREQQTENGYGLQVGMQAEDFTLDDPDGNPVRLFEQLSQGPVVLAFYRGAWCPFCNIQLRAYQSILPEIRKLGGKLIALSPQSPDRTLEQQNKEGLRFPVLSDTNGQVASRYNVLFEVPPYLQEAMVKRLRIDLADYNAKQRWILPIPAAFIIDKNRIIRSAYANPDFMLRMEPQEILDTLKKL